MEEGGKGFFCKNGMAASIQRALPDARFSHYVVLPRFSTPTLPGPALPEDLLRELIATAWHPRRVQSWCLDIEEMDELGSRTLSEVGIKTSGFWYDEVLVGTEGQCRLAGIQGYSTASSVRFVHSNGRRIVEVCARPGRVCVFDSDKVCL